MASVEELTQSVRSLIQKHQQHESDVAQRIKNAVDTALADDEIKDSEALRALKEEIDAVLATPAPVTPPEFEPSNQ